MRRAAGGVGVHRDAAAGARVSSADPGPMGRRAKVFRVTLRTAQPAVGYSGDPGSLRRESYVVASSFNQVLAACQAKGERFDVEEIAVLLSDVAVLP